MTTKGRLAEQILRLYNGGDISADHSISLEEVMLMVTQAVNTKIKKEYYSTHYPLSERIPPRSAIATYDDIAVTPYGTVTSGVSCTPVDGDGFYVFWSTGDDFWDTGDGGFWSVQIADVTFDITRAVVSGKVVHSVVIDNITYPDTITFAEVEAFITDCPSTSAIMFSGTNTGVPNVYLRSGITNIVVDANTISFDYTIEDTASANAVMTSYAATSHGILQSIFDPASYTTEFRNIQCCEDIDNTGTLLGQVRLPVQPMNLPNGMGVWKVYSKDTPNDPFIPIPTGFYGLGVNTTHNKLGASLALLNCYEFHSNDIILFNQLTVDLPAAVSIQLVVTDPDAIGEYDPLPVPPEMELEIIADILQLLRGTPPEDQSVDGNSTTR